MSEPELPPRWLLWLPLALFALLAAIVAFGLAKPSDPNIGSKLVGQPLPAFTLPPSQPGRPGLASVDFGDGHAQLLNVFASWCVPCAAEAPQLVALRDAGVAIDAIAIRDRPEDTARFLARYGDPFQRIGRDDTSSVQLDIGSSGVPETFLIDGKGVIRLQHIGEIRPEDVPALITAVRDAA